MADKDQELYLEEQKRIKAEIEKKHGKSTEELYKEREKRNRDTVELRIPDRIPISLNVDPALSAMKANHRGAEVMLSGLLKPVKIEPGQFITGRNSLWQEYHQLHLKKRKPSRKPAPSLITVYRWLLTLQEMELLM